MSAPVASKAAYESEPPSPFGWACGLVLLRPLHRQRDGNAGRAALFQERGELYETDLSLLQFESKTAAHLHVILDRFTPWGHCTPPGQGRANVASEAKSTFV